MFGRGSLIFLTVGATCAGLFCLSAHASTGYADEFVSTLVDCTESSCLEKKLFWSLSSFLDGPTWELMGQQSATTAGRANAREEVMFKYRDESATASGKVTVNIARYYTASPPAVGSLCSAASVTYTGASASATLGTLVGSPADTNYNNRLLPILDFSLDTATSGFTRGYVSTVTVTGDHLTGTTADNCYVISWF